ncbi:MAG: PRD domain-containing protein [Lachnospiraceae bacterium]
MQKELYERIGILEKNEIISVKVADYARKIVDYILSRCPGVSQDKMEMFITHLAMAGKRAEERTEENPIDEGILEAVKMEAVFPEAVEIRDRILSMTDIVFQETEKDFLSVHLCNFLS